MNKKFCATGIVYDTDGVKVKGLPTILVVECEDEEEVVDAISDKTGWCVKSVEGIFEITYDYIRDGFAFSYTFDAGINRENLRFDVEGSDVYREKDGIYLGHVDDITPDEIRKMCDRKFEEFLKKNHIR